MLGHGDFIVHPSGERQVSGTRCVASRPRRQASTAQARSFRCGSPYHDDDALVPVRLLSVLDLESLEHSAYKQGSLPPCLYECLTS